MDRLVDHFGTLQKLLSAGIDDLQAVDGVGELRARSVREGLSRLAESTILERYVLRRSTSALTSATSVGRAGGRGHRASGGLPLLGGLLG